MNRQVMGPFAVGGVGGVDAGVVVLAFFVGGALPEGDGFFRIVAGVHHGDHPLKIGLGLMAAGIAGKVKTAADIKNGIEDPAPIGSPGGADRD